MPIRLDPHTLAVLRQMVKLHGTPQLREALADLTALAEAEALERAYAEAEAFDRRMAEGEAKGAEESADEMGELHKAALSQGRP